jgi:hypothetical protein
MKNWTTKFWDWVDSRAVVRRSVLYFTLYMTATVTYQAWLFAHSSTFDGLGTAAVIAAITAPTAALQTYAFRDYISGKGKTE